MALAGRAGLVVYNIRFRPDGVGFEWYDVARQGVRSDFEAGLVCHGYHPDLHHAVAAELARLVSGPLPRPGTRL